MIEFSAVDDLRDVAAGLLQQASQGTLQSLEPLSGGRNNRVYRVTSSSGLGVMKHYHHSPTTGHDRFATEMAWYRCCERHNVGHMPRLWASDANARCALFSLIPGRKLLPNEVSDWHVSQAANYVVEVNAGRFDPATANVPNASEACFSIDEHCSRVAHRVERLRQIPLTDSVNQVLHSWLTGPFQEVWQQVLASISQNDSPEMRQQILSPEKRCLSPSDFGFHNALFEDASSWGFFDFEYAGWDDPAKLVCDFFWQVELPAPRSSMSMFLDVLKPWGDELPQRVHALFPLYGLKWCTIVLNEFLRDGQHRRQFAAGNAAGTDRRRDQLQIANSILQQVRSQLEENPG